MPNFIDEAKVVLVSGDGGDGSASFRREKHVPRGGPEGADGGRGGDVVLVADHHVRTLYDVRLHGAYKAESGGRAHGNKTGKDGANVEVKVPVGTVVYDEDTGDALADLSVTGARYVACRGGKGGFGNLHFANSVRQAPTIAQKGAPGETLEARLELKLIADVGLVGLPNAGKSTLLSAVSAAKPKIGSYPFTTIEPNLGVVKAGDTTFVIADLPGLIEGASEGHGLGHQFLRHAERTRVLVHVVDGFPIDGSDPIDNYHKIEKELSLYSDQLGDKAKIVAMNKTDLAPPDDVEVMVGFFQEAGVEVIPVSAATGAGTERLIFEAARLLAETDPPEPVHVIVPEFKKQRDLTWDAEQEEEGAYVVTGDRIERLIHMTDLENSESIRYLHRRLERIGVIKRLRDLGIEEGDSVQIGTVVFEYKDW
ncbi:MAG TPA: GTPase ObgE [Fimbriimonadaceae bacterium]|nr:GTPase ObgE [Fimbriimonadaceae bacterium]